MIRGIGVDVVAVARLRRWLEDERLLKRYFAGQEREAIYQRRDGAALSLAARFAAKEAFAKALGDGQGMTRFGDAWVPMDEALVHAALDISGRPFLSCGITYPQERVGSFDSILLSEFLRAFVQHAGITLHVRQLAGENSHHILEATAKAVARALAAAVVKHPKVDGVLSTKDWLELGSRTEETH